MMKILVVGATGLLARPVIRHLDKAGFEVRLFSRSVDSTKFEKPFECIQGDVFVPEDLEKAIAGCDAVHISLSRLKESEAVRLITKAASGNNIKLITLVSGCTVSSENRWFPMIDDKFQAEQVLMNCGIPYIIFRPTWFFESLKLMVRDGKAMIIGNQKHPYHWLAADDFGRMVANACKETSAWNRIFYILGPESCLMKDMLERYCSARHPEIKKVSVIPISMMNLIAWLSGKKDMKAVAGLFAYFEKVPEQGDPTEANQVLGKPEISFEKWLGTAAS